MKIRYFTLRMALLSVCFSAAVLAVFAILCMSAIRRIGLERIDRELQALADTHVRGPKPPMHWDRIEDSLAAVYGESRRNQFLVMVTGPDNVLVFRSPRWPAGLGPETLGLPPSAARSNGHSAFDRPSFRDGPGAPPDDWPGEPPDDRRGDLRAPPPGDFAPMAPRWITVAVAGRPWRFIVMENGTVRLLLGMSLDELNGEIRHFRNAFAMAAPLALLFLAGMGGLLAAQAIRPIQVLTAMAAGVTARGLDQRVKAGDADREFQALIDVINGMLDRLEKSFRQATRFSADAAHELKTPLTILQGQLQQALRNAPAESAEQQRCAGLLEEVQRLKVIVRKLLLLAQADAGEMRLNRSRLDLSGEVAALCEDAVEAAGSLRVTQRVHPGLFVMCDADLLRQAMQNLVSNAIKYNRPDGYIEFQLEAENGRASLAITNSTAAGIQLDPEHLFERFYRGDKSHSREVEGAGLGLSLAREIARAHGGDVVLREIGEGKIAFAMDLPLATATTAN